MIIGLDISILYYRKDKRVNTCDDYDNNDNCNNEKDDERSEFSEIGEGKLKCAITNMKNSSSSIYIYSSHLTSQN